MERPMETVGLKENPAGGLQYRNTFYPGVPSLDEAQSIRVSPEVAANDIRFTVPTEKNIRFEPLIALKRELSSLYPFLQHALTHFLELGMFLDV